MSSSPIGIFDSGIGGLAVAHAVSQLMPKQNIIYFGDTAHMPWGGKSITAIQHYTTKICNFLLDYNCKIIVIACNTASSVALDTAKKCVQDQAVLFNVIDPVINHIQNNYTNQSIGLIGTKQTILANTYQQKIKSLKKRINLKSLATPLLVPLIEEGFIQTPATELIIQEYLSNQILSNIHSLILGCTHYPLIKQQISNYYKNKIDIIDSAYLLAISLKKYILNNNLENYSSTPKRSFFVSDNCDFFTEIAQKFLADSCHLESFPLWL